jgi:hypothetical protein
MISLEPHFSLRKVGVFIRKEDTIMNKSSHGLMSVLPYLCLVSMIALGSMAMVGCGGDGGEGAVSIAGPSGLTAVLNASSEIVLAWQDNSTNEDGFQIEKSTDGTTFSVLADISADTTTYSDEELSGGTIYWYRVCASAGSFFSDYSNTAISATPWAKTYGEVDSERAQSIWHTSDRGYITTGGSTSFGGLWAVKLHPDGTVDWEKTYSESGSWGERIIQQTSDGGYIVAGGISSTITGIDARILKLNSDGSIEWQKSYGGPSDDDDILLSIQQTSDGGYIAAGYTGETLTFPFIQMIYDMWALKLDSSGTIDWQYKYHLNDEDYAHSIQQTSDGGYIMAGETRGVGGSDVLVVKLNPDGAIEWQKSYGGSADEIAQSIVQTSSGYIFAGGTRSFGVSGSDIWIVNIDTAGAIEWEKTYGSADDEWAQSVCASTEGGFAVAGYTKSFGEGKGDIWILKLNSDGSVSWQKAYGGTEPDYSYCIRQTTDQGYAVAGTSYTFGAGLSDFWLLKLASDGSIEFSPASGAVVMETVATGTDTSATVSATNITPALTTVTASDTSETPSDTSAVIDQQAP